KPTILKKKTKMMTSYSSTLGLMLLPAIYIALTAEVPTTLLLTVNTSLNRQQRKKAKEILLNNHQIFAKNISEEEQTLELRQTTEVCHEINTPDAKPIKQ
ncbi:15619_t:CDS:1, partial [Racocetra persica]